VAFSYSAFAFLLCNHFFALFRALAAEPAVATRRTLEFGNVLGVSIPRRLLPRDFLVHSQRIFRHGFSIVLASFT
jgi:hypothetical protein